MVEPPVAARFPQIRLSLRRRYPYPNLAFNSNPLSLVTDELPLLDYHQLRIDLRRRRKGPRQRIP
jgi:hypothetical protein